MPRVTESDVGQTVAEMNTRYQPHDGNCVATPAAMSLMLQHLRDYTVEVQKVAEAEGLDDDSKVQQWALDMGAWQQRLARYQSELDQVPEKEWNTKAGCEAIYSHVTAPLLDGIWYEILPGIVLDATEKSRIQSGTGHPATDIGRCTDRTCQNVVVPEHPGGHSNPKPPDVATPFMLGNQVLVYQEWQKKRWDLFWKDLWDETKKLYEKIKKAGKGALDVGGGLVPWILATVAVVGLGYVYVKHKDSKKKPRDFDQKAA